MQRTTRRIAIASQKGGVGKTTTAWNVAAGLTAKGCDVLVVDLDGQCHLTTGVLGTPPERSLWDVLMGSMTAEEAIVQGPEFALLSASEMLSRADYDLGGRPGRDFLLSRALKGRRDPGSGTRAPGVQDDYDYIILDCPPSLGIMTANALAYASEVIVPVTPGLFAVSGLGMLGSVIAETIDAGVNEDLAIAGILLTQYGWYGSAPQHRVGRGGAVPQAALPACDSQERGDRRGTRRGAKRPVLRAEESRRGRLHRTRYASD
ncbi:MAG: hypothetical protein XD74_2193 [Actinobacteria bacterium 66_15]|nr:MAG: hypothetical protein XD74_2193 [Actinobacteria bacterium 66_15]